MALPFAAYAIASRAAATDPPMAPQDYAGQYRTLSDIVWSCLTTIFLCTWVSYHPDVPEPINMNGVGRWKRIKVHGQRFIKHRLTRFLVALIAPEWILGDSLTEFVYARSLAKSYGFSLSQAFFIHMEGFHYFDRGGTVKNDVAMSVPTVSSTVESIPLVTRDNDAPQRGLRWSEDNDTPRRRLRWSDVVHLRNADKLRIPCPNEIQDRSKNDWISKSLVLVQTTWFIAQCIGRGAQHLPLTELEVITLGYTAVNVLIYIIWWEKPYQVAEPVRVYDKPLDGEMKLEELEDGNDQAGLVIFGMGVVYGALHFIAWASLFPSPVERLLWRVSTIVLTANPLVVVLFWVLTNNLDFINPGKTFFNVGGVFISISYITARAITLVLAFKTLAHLSPDVYRNIEWANFIPHI